MTTLLINTIYKATEGEGIHVGIPQIFVRFQGCSVGCVNCDSKETWEFDPSFSRDLDSVVAEVEKISDGKIKRVSITGGDPLHPGHVPGVLALIKELKARKYFINIEAAGTRIVDEIFDLVDFISYDYKTPSTGVRTSKDLLLKLVEQYGHKAQIKSVIAHHKDFEATYEVYYQTQSKLDKVPGTWVLTPCYEPSELFPMERFQQILRLNEEFGAPFRVIGQQHKWVYGADQKSV